MQDSELEYIEHIKEAPLKLMVVSLESSSPHWHNEYETILVLRGAVTVGLESGSCELGTGDIMLVNPRDVHSFRKNGQDNICIILQFSPGVILEVYEQPFVFELNTASGSLLPEQTLSTIRRRLAEMCLLMHEKPDGYQFAIKSGLYAFIGLMFSSLKYSIPAEENIAGSDEYLSEFDMIKQYIKQHFKEEIDQNQIGHALGMSRTKVYRLLRAAGSASTKDMTHYYRVEYAKHLLKNTDSPIQYIASESGFDSDSTFYRIFRGIVGMSPRAYRNSPAKDIQYTGIQGYAGYSVHESIALLRGYL